MNNVSMKYMGRLVFPLWLIEIAFILCTIYRTSVSLNEHGGFQSAVLFNYDFGIIQKLTIEAQLYFLTFLKKLLVNCVICVARE